MHIVQTRIFQNIFVGHLCFLPPVHSNNEDKVRVFYAIKMHWQSKKDCESGCYVNLVKLWLYI